MTELSHQQAQQSLHLQADDQLDVAQRAALTRHLRDCDQCRADSHGLDQLASHLRQDFRTRWDSAPAPAAPLVTEGPASESPWPRAGRIAANLLILVLWLWLYRAVFDYLRVIFYHSEFRVNQILMAAVLVLIIFQIRQSRLRFQPDTRPHIYLPALAVALGASLAYLLVERFLDINTLSATLFALASYGLIGLWLSPGRWYGGLPVALLLAGTLPFGEHLQTFIGYPVRLVTAAIVGDGLSALGIQSIGVDTILVMESGFAQVDNPCSGIKSLWTGMLFVLAVTWLERHPINWRWLGTATLTAILLLAANLARVAILVLVDQVLGWTLLAEMIHVPLGMLGFGLVCAVAVLLLRGRAHSFVPQFTPQNGYPRPLWLVPALAFIIAAMAVIYTPRAQSAAAQQPVLAWQIPARLDAQPDPLSPALYDWVTEGGAETADRWRFTWLRADGRPITGSFMLIASTDWRAQHRPERCFEVQGLFSDSAQTAFVGADFPVRQLVLDGGGQKVTAVYWLQTGDLVTDDYAKRIWADLAPQRERWVLVTVLFDQIHALDDHEIRALLADIRGMVAQGLLPQGE